MLKEDTPYACKTTQVWNTKVEFILFMVQAIPLIVLFIDHRVNWVVQVNILSLKKSL